jgi:hypothetical protein
LTLQHALDENLNLVDTIQDDLTINVYGSVDQNIEIYGLNGWTTDSTHRLYIENTEAGWDGKWDDSVWHITMSDASSSLILYDDYVNFKKIMFEKTSINGNYQVFLLYRPASASNEFLIDSCLFKGVGSGDTTNRDLYISTGEYSPAPILRIFNSVFFDGTGTSHPDSVYVKAYSTAAPTIDLDNCMFNGCYHGVHVDAGTVTTYNCLYTNQVNNPTEGTFDSGSDYNSTDSATAVANNNTNDLESQTITYGAAASGDFSLQSGSDGVDDGGSSPSYSFSVDIIGTSRPQNSVWDRGAFELLSAEGWTAETDTTIVFS